MDPLAGSGDAREIHALATRAIVDNEFRSALLNGQRREKLREFSLSVGAVDEILKIQATTLQDFIEHLCVLTEPSGSDVR